MKNQEQQIEPFVSIPRYVLDDLRDGIITPREFEVYILVRLQANPYGIATVSIESILADIPTLKSTDWTSKVMRSLRCPRYLYYQVRQGHRGSFRVHFGNWKMPNKIIRQITNLFSEEELRSLTLKKRIELSEEDAKSYASTPKSESTKSLVNEDDFDVVDTTRLRSSHNDTDTENDTKYSSSAYKKEKTAKKVRTTDFKPQNEAEQRCKDIATEVRDPYIAYALSVLRDENEGGLDVLEDALFEYHETIRYYERKRQPIHSPPALFNTCVEKVKNNKEYYRERREISKKYDDIPSTKIEGI